MPRFSSPPTARPAESRAAFISRPAFAAPPLWRPPRRCLRCGKAVRDRRRTLPHWRRPGAGGGGHFAEPQSNILTAPGTTAILADAGGNIIDDPSPNPSCCCGCPSSCYIPRTGNEICDCIPQRFLVIATGLSGQCPCFDYQCPQGLPPPGTSAEVLHFDYSGSYCFSGGDPPEGKHIGGFPAKVWGSDNGDCSSGILLDFGTIATMRLDTAFGASVIIEVWITGFLNGGTQFAIFHRRLTGQTCKGPWVLTNDLSGCGTDCSGSGPAYMVAAAGTLAIYPCVC